MHTEEKSRQNKSRKNQSRHFFEVNFNSFKKKQVLVRLEPRTFAVPGVFVTTGYLTIPRRISCAKDNAKFVFIMNQGRYHQESTEPVGLEFFEKEDTN